MKRPLAATFGVVPSPCRPRLFAFLAIAVALFLTTACGGESDTDATGAAETTPTEQAEPAGEEAVTPTEAAQTEAEVPVPQEAADDAADQFTTPAGVTCTSREPEVVSDRPTFSEPPAFELDEGVSYTATLETSCGTIVLELDAESAPLTANNFVVLTRSGFYDGITFHRAVPGFVIQGGDPLGNGTGGPGYTFEDELPDDGYALGDLAMANAGPDTNGSQFFIVTGDASQLPNQFSKFGVVVEGLDVAQAIESLGDPVTQAPVEPVYIYSVEITES